MARYLSPEWLDDLASVMSADEVLLAVRCRLCIVVRVLGAPWGDVAYEISAGNGTAAVTRETSGRADVELTTDYATARAIASGAANAQNAFVAGTLRLSGALDRLAAGHEIFAAIDAASAPLRERTEFD
jgi:hypothetical protein